MIISVLTHYCVILMVLLERFLPISDRRMQRVIFFIQPVVSMRSSVPLSVSSSIFISVGSFSLAILTGWTVLFTPMMS